MIHIRTAEPSDKEIWNEIALNSKDGTYAHTWEWAEIVADIFGYVKIMLVAEDRGKIVGIYSGFKNNIKLKLPGFINNLFNIFYSPIALTYDYGGPAVLDGYDTAYIELLKYMEMHARVNHVVTCQISPYLNEREKFFIDAGYTRRDRYTWMIPLDVSTEKLTQGMKKSMRGVKKAQKLGVTVRKAGPEDLKDIYRCLRDVDIRAAIGLPNIKFFYKLMELYYPKDWVRFYVSEHDGEITGASVIFTFNGLAVERYRGSYMKYRGLYSENAIIYRSLLDLHSEGFKLFDFGGLPSDKNSGIYFFKSRWGGHPKAIPWYKKDIHAAYSYMKGFGKFLKE